jgi:hypothetical protein
VGVPLATCSPATLPTGIMGMVSLLFPESLLVVLTHELFCFLFVFIIRIIKR